VACRLGFENPENPSFHGEEKELKTTHVKGFTRYFRLPLESLSHHKRVTPWHWRYACKRALAMSESRRNAFAPSGKLQEVVRSLARYVVFASARRRVELQESVVLVLIKFHDGGLVTTAIAVVGS